MSKVYSQAVFGKYRSLKNLTVVILLLVYFIPPWIRWFRPGLAPKQAILIDLPMRRGYFFDLEIWPEEVFYITFLLMTAAFGLFLFTSIFGRVWCGYTCPHTVFVDLFTKIETFFQGDRNSRIKLDQESMTFRKLLKKTATHVSWLILAFTFAFGWVCYFLDAPTLFKSLYQGSLSSGAQAWLFGLTFSTYFFGGIVRERVCFYMCPYGRFQSAMLDHETTIVTYHSWRGEPRLVKTQTEQPAGDCVNCGRCVTACPVGIDIRDGLQMGCINCGLCVDACDDVMNKINKPLGLISYDSIKSTAAKMNKQIFKRNFWRFKTILYTGFVCASVILTGYQLLNKNGHIITIERERSPLFTVLPSGAIRNTFYATVTNRTFAAKKFCLSIKNPGYYLKVQGAQSNLNSSDHAFCFELLPNEYRSLKLFVQSHPWEQQKIHAVTNDITFELVDNSTQQSTQINSIYFDKP